MSLVGALAEQRPDARFFAAAPTREQARRIWWDDLKRLVPRGWLARPPADATLTLDTRWGAQLCVIGLDRPQRIEGSPWDGCVIDEFADCRRGTWDAHIRPALADRKGWAWLIGVPDRAAPGQADYRRLYDLARSGSDPDWSCHHWPSSDILPPAEVDALRRAMDEETFRQELLGEFVLAAALAFPMFEPAAHVAPTRYDPARPLAWALDFNVNPMCSGLLQHDPSTGLVRVLHEFTLPDSSTDAACDAVIEHCAARGWSLMDVRVYGDATGHARDSTSGRSDWAIVMDRLRRFRPRKNVPLRSPLIKDTLNALRARLRAADGGSRLLIHPDCRRLIAELQQLPWPGDLSEGHCVAWLRYFTQWEYPVRPDAVAPEPGRFSV